MKILKPEKSYLYVHGLMLVAIMLAASSFPVGALITNALPPAVLMFIRFLLAALLFLPFVTLRAGLKIPEINEFIKYSILSVPLVFFFWCMFESLRYTSVVNTGALYTLVPAFTAVFAYVINKELTQFSRIFGLLLGTAGALWVVFRGNPKLFLELHMNYGDLVFVLGCISLSLYNPLLKRFHTGEPMMVLTFWVLLCGSILLFFLSLLSLSEVKWSQIHYSIYIGTLYLAVFSTLVTFIIINYSTIRLGATKVAAYGFLTPFFVIVMSLLMGIERFEPSLIPGIVLILGSMIFVQYDMKHGTIK